MNIKSVKLLRDLPECKAGQIGYPDDDVINFRYGTGDHDITFYMIEKVLEHPDWFEVSYEEKVKDYFVMICLSSKGFNLENSRSQMMTKEKAYELIAHLMSIAGEVADES